MYTRCICRAEERTEVLRILNTVEEKQQRFFSARTRCRNNLLNGDVGDGSGVCEHALVADALGY